VRKRRGIVSNKEIGMMSKFLKNPAETPGWVCVTCASEEVFHDRHGEYARPTLVAVPASRAPVHLHIVKGV